MEADGETSAEEKAVAAAPITALIAAQVRRLRKEARLSGPALASKLVDLGINWNRTTIAKFETGARNSISVQELLALAIALDVPPVLLIADPRHQELGDVPLAKDLSGDPWGVLLWMVGVADVPGGRQARDDSQLIHAGITVMEALGELKRRVRTLDPAEGQERTDTAHREALLRVASAFGLIRRLGAEPPQLADHHIERARELGVDLYGQDY